MKTYIVSIETRKGYGNNLLGPFKSFEAARRAVLEKFNWTEEKWRGYDKFDSSWDNGVINTEEWSAEIIERDLM